MQAEGEAAYWRQKELLQSTNVQKLQLELQQLRPKLIKMKKQLGSNNLIQKFLDKHGPKVTRRQQDEIAARHSLYDAVQALSAR